MTQQGQVARRMYELVEPIGVVNFQADEPNEAMRDLGFTNYWDGYFAGRSAPLGKVPAEVVHALFYNFADGEVARHVPRVWEKVTPEEARSARERGCVAALRRILAGQVDSAALDRAGALLARAAAGVRTEGRPLFAALRALPVPDEPVARLWHTADMLREHRGDGHIAALVTEGINGTEAHVLAALDMGMRAEEFGRIHHLPAARLAAVVDGLRDRGLVDAKGGFTAAGRDTKTRIEARTDELAFAPYGVLDARELAQLAADLTPIAAVLRACGSR